MTPSKVNNFTVTDFNDGEVDEISDKEFKRMIIRMIDAIKDDTNKYLDEFKENANK
jgi:hypothetical protein